MLKYQELGTLSSIHHLEEVSTKCRLHLITAIPPVDTCLADNTTHSAVLDWLFGFNPNCTTDTNPSDCPMPSVGSMLHAVGDYTWDSCQEIRGARTILWNIYHIFLWKGIKTNLFKTNWHIDTWNADLSVKYYWSGKEEERGKLIVGTHILETSDMRLRIFLACPWRFRWLDMALWSVRIILNFGLDFSPLHHLDCIILGQKID